MVRQRVALTVTLAIASYDDDVDDKDNVEMVFLGQR